MAELMYFIFFIVEYSVLVAIGIHEMKYVKA